MAVNLTSEQVAAKIDEIDRLLLSDKQWTRDAPARNKDGKKVKADSPDACAWSLQGAAWKVTGNHTHQSQVNMCLMGAINRPMILLGQYNDSTDFVTVKELLYRAKEIAKTKEPFQPLPPANNLAVFAGVMMIIGSGLFAVARFVH